MFYFDLRDFEPEFTLITDDNLTIQIEKLGGGTVGKSYEGTWRYIVTNTDTGSEVRRGQNLVTGTPKTHEEAARILLDFMWDE